MVVKSQRYGKIESLNKYLFIYKLKKKRGETAK